MDIMEQVKTLTECRVAVGPGTLYNLLEQFADAGMIRETKAQGRRRSYIITEKGREALEQENARMRTMLADYRCFMEGEKDA